MVINEMMTVQNHTLTFTYDSLGVESVDYDGTMYYYLRNAQGDITGIVDTSGNVVTEYVYDAWGNVLSTTGSKATTVGKYSPFRYRGYIYDDSGLYYLQTRYYDPAMGRWLNIDSTVGVNRDMFTYNLYAYCGGNPSTRYDVGGRYWEAPLSGILHGMNDFAVKMGIDTAEIGAYFLMMEKDENNIYHATYNCWQQFAGYNDLYDKIFDMATDMVSAKFVFTYANTNFVIWAWKGDYINLGAGAELGIYRYGFGGHWIVDKDYSMEINLFLLYKNELIIRVEPTMTWWCTGFNPAYQNVSTGYLNASFVIRFTNSNMFYAFINTWGGDSRCGYYMFQGFGFVTINI